MPEIYKLGDAHRPALPPGRYELRVDWKVDIDGEPAVENIEKTEFRIASERFWLNPSEIESVYPPDGSAGYYGDDLPHAVLSRDTLPWERSAKAGSDEPWLALLLLGEQEAAQCPLKTTTLKAYRDTLAAYPQTVILDLEPGQENESVQVIEIPHDVPQGVLPQLRELSTLCHTRVVESAGSAAAASALVVSKRLPSPGRNTVHLVMLEHRFTGEDFPLPTNGSKCLLISLVSWTFTSQDATDVSNDDQSRAAPFGQLGADWLQLPVTDASTNYEKAGFVPLRHRFRSGEAGASWYAGPLNCGVPIFSIEQAAEIVKLPAESADDLLWYDETLGMLNITYAAAWELGRLLAMQNRSIFALLHHWRRQQIHCHQAAHAAKEGACCHLPQIQCACAEPAAEAPSELKQWLNGLRRLEGIRIGTCCPMNGFCPRSRYVFWNSIKITSTRCSTGF